jgi:small-conductance mechanosensitive channel
MPAHVGVPLLLCVLAIGGTGLAAVAVGLPTAAVVGVVAVVTVLAALAAHRTVSSLAVGAGVLLAQPYRAGDEVRAYVPSLRRTVEAEVVRVGAANTTLLVRDVDGPETAIDSLVVVPNNQMLRAS